MDFLHSELNVQRGEIVVVELRGNAANVRLFDDDNFGRFKSGDAPFHHAGGFATETPVRLKPPWEGRWHLVVDLGGGAGQVDASISVRAE